MESDKIKIVVNLGEKLESLTQEVFKELQVKRVIRAEWWRKHNEWKKNRI